jgi:ABC-type antimicrobial peptide transport system permease subunit
VLGEGAVIAVAGIVAGAIAGVLLARFAGGYIQGVRIPGALPVAAAASVLVAAAILASLLPAARASRVDVIQALRAD